MPLIEEALTRSIIGAFCEVYNNLGFGFLEHIYAMALERELRARGHIVGREVSVPVYYKGEELARQRLDMLVDAKVVVELKSTYELHKAAPRQLYSYLSATRLELGLLLYFGPKPSFFRLLYSNDRKRQVPGLEPTVAQTFDRGRHRHGRTWQGLTVLWPDNSGAAEVASGTPRNGGTNNKKDPDLSVPPE